MMEAMIRQRTLFAHEGGWNRTFSAPPPRVRPEHEQSAFSALSGAAKRACCWVFLDTEWAMVYLNSSGMVTDSLTDDGALRAFFFSKSHARCRIDNGERRWKNGII
jgi:hypothetical protein